MTHQTNTGQSTGLPQTSVSHMYPRIWSYYGGVGRVYCDYCRTFLMTEAKRKTKQISKIQPCAPSCAHLQNQLGGVFRSACLSMASMVASDRSGSDSLVT